MLGFGTLTMWYPAFWKFFCLGGGAGSLVEAIWWWFGGFLLWFLKILMADISESFVALANLNVGFVGQSTIQLHTEDLGDLWSAWCLPPPFFVEPRNWEPWLHLPSTFFGKAQHETAAIFSIGDVTHRIHVCYIIPTYIWLTFMVNVGMYVYTMHGSYGFSVYLEANLIFGLSHIPNNLGFLGKIYGRVDPWGDPGNRP